MDHARVSAVLLAAGESRRMGGPNKLLLEHAGRPLLRAAAETLLASGVRELIVVLGHQHREAQRLLDGLALRCVINAEYRSGQMSSVRTGIEALGETADGIMICLADQPWLQVDDYRFLIDAYRRLPQAVVLIPTVQGRRGNPIILDGRRRADLLASGKNFGCRQFIANNPELVTTVEAPNAHFVRDIDTAQDYAALVGAAA